MGLEGVGQGKKPGHFPSPLRATMAESSSSSAPFPALDLDHNGAGWGPSKDCLPEKVSPKSRSRARAHGVGADSGGESHSGAAAWCGAPAGTAAAARTLLSATSSSMPERACRARCPRPSRPGSLRERAFSQPSPPSTHTLSLAPPARVSPAPAQFSMLPFATFNRGEKVGKAADFGGYLNMRQRESHRARARQEGPRITARAQSHPHSFPSLPTRARPLLSPPFAGGQFRRGLEENMDLAGPLYEAGDSAFVTVDTSKAPRRNAGYKPRGARGGMRGGRGGGPSNVRGWEDRKVDKVQGSSFNKRYNKLTRARWVQNGGRSGPRTLREGSVRVGVDWDQLELYDLAQLNKLQTAPPQAQDVRWVGSLDAYDEDFDRVTGKKPLKLRTFPNKQVKVVGAVKDPVFEELAEAGQDHVFVTDSVLSHLMAASRSVYPWDIVVSYIGGTIFLDARSPEAFNIHTVNETSHQPPSEEDKDEKGEEDINCRSHLSSEATIIHHDFTQQVREKRREKEEDR
jgi:hypothetical protein